jgi:hypothetical protein
MFRVEDEGTSTADFSETSMSVHITRRHIPENRNIASRHRENIQ